MKKNYSLLATAFIACFFSITVNSQTTNVKASAGKYLVGGNSASRLWMADSNTMSGNLKTFQENKGQFLNFMNDWKIAYGADAQGTQVLFTNKGVIYYLPQNVKLTEKEQEAREKNESLEKQENEHENYKTVYNKVSVEWENANPNPTIEAVDKTSYYFGCIIPEKETGIDNIPGFKKLIYHDVYPGVDIEFTFHPVKGIEYAVKVKPGYDASVVKMLYKGQDNLSIDADGNVRIKTPVGDMIDHAPVSTQNGNKVSSSFEMLSKNEVAFKMGDIDKSSELTIDPWVYSPVTVGYYPSDIGMDNANNVYVLNWNGGLYSGACVIQKYSALGALL